MAIPLNVRHLETRSEVLRGELPVAELEVELRDDVVRFLDPLRYELQAERLGGAILVRGHLEVELRCTCVRCLKEFAQRLTLADWACHLPLEGEERVATVHDVVDLTPWAREDILLALPQHPLCEPECRGLPSALRVEVPNPGGGRQTPNEVSVWGELDKLKF